MVSRAQEQVTISLGGQRRGRRAIRVRQAVIFAAVLAVLATLAAALSGCGTSLKPAVTASEGFPVTVVDSYGRNVTIPRRPERIVSLAPSHTEVLFALGLGPRVCGVTKYCDYPAEAREKPDVGGFANPSVERILELKPDLVVATEAQKTLVGQLESLGMPVIAVAAKTVGEVPDLISTIGRAAGVDSRAATLTADLKARIEKVTSGTKTILEKDRTRVYYELWFDPITSVGPGSFLHDLIGLAGGINIMGDAKSAYPTASQEIIIQRNPQVILYAHGRQRTDQISWRPGWTTISAVKAGRIISFPDENIFMRAGPRIVDALEELARILDPAAFR